MCNRGPRLQPNFAQEVSARRTGSGGRAAAAGQQLPVAARRLPVAGSGQRRGDPGPASAGPVQLDRPVAAGENNEHTSMRIRTPGGAEVIVVVQIAGLLARRMVCDVPVDDKLSNRATYGLIGSDPGWTTTTPAGTDPLVGIGQRAVAGATTLAELS